MYGLRLLDILNRPIVLVPAVEVIIEHRKDDKTPEHKAGPIHVYQRGVRHRRETDHDVRYEEVNERDGVDVETAHLAEVKLRGKERLSDQALSQHQTKDDDVGRDNAKPSQCDDDIEGNRGADIDETQQCCYSESRTYCVDRDAPARRHLGTMSVEVVARKWMENHT